MSCIAGIINGDRAPVSRELLDAMTSAMKDRAPDGCDLWCSGHVGFGHAMLRIPPESEKQHQPCTLDGRVWITADARIDGRPELIAQLRSAGRLVPEEAPDAELILHAYHAFGEPFLEHLIGDFAFALWDDRSEELICARDHFGVRPFYYARTDSAFLFASDIDALLAHPAIGATLDENAVGDFMLLGSYHDAEATIYRDVRCLPAASRLSVHRTAFHVRRYWEPPVDVPVRYRDRLEYVEHFRELMTLAVHDRLRADHVALELSGGMDSTAVAAIAAARARTGGCALTAYTNTCNQLFPEEQEGHFAGMVAAHLSIPIVLRELGAYSLFERLGSPALKTAEPSSNPYLAFFHDTLAHIGRTGARVVLSGQGGDAMLDNTFAYHAHLLRSGRVARLVVELLSHIRHTGSFRGMGIRYTLKEGLGTGNRRSPSPPGRPPFPDWLDPGFVERTRLGERWDAAWATLQGSDGTFEQLRLPWLSRTFSSYEMFKLPMVARHPFFDVRLATFMLGVPGFVKSDKKILREAMRHALPEPVRTRPKAWVVGDIVRSGFLRNSASDLAASRLSMVSNRYIVRERYLQALERYRGGEGSGSEWPSIGVVTPVTLDYWLAGRAGRIDA